MRSRAIGASALFLSLSLSLFLAARARVRPRSALTPPFIPSPCNPRPVHHFQRSAACSAQARRVEARAAAIAQDKRAHIVQVGQWVRIPETRLSKGRFGRVVSLPAIFTTELRVCSAPLGDGDSAEGTVFCPPTVIRDMGRMDGITEHDYIKLGWPPKLFGRADKNADGTLSHNELRRACEELDPKDLGFLRPFHRDAVRARRCRWKADGSDAIVAWTPAELREDAAMELAAIAQRTRYHYGARQRRAVASVGSDAAATPSEAAKVAATSDNESAAGGAGATGGGPGAAGPSAVRAAAAAAAAAAHRLSTEVDWSAVFAAMDIARDGVAQVEEKVQHMCAITFEQGAVMRARDAARLVHTTARRASHHASHVASVGSAAPDARGADVGTMGASSSGWSPEGATLVSIDAAAATPARVEGSPTSPQHSRALSDAKKAARRALQAFEGGSTHAKFIISASSREAVLRAHAMLAQRLERNKLRWVDAVRAQTVVAGAGTKADRAARLEAETRWSIKKSAPLHEDWTREAISAVLRHSLSATYAKALSAAAAAVRISGPNFALVRIFDRAGVFDSGGGARGVERARVHAAQRSHAIPTMLVPVDALTAAFDCTAPLLVAAEVGLSPAHISLIGRAAATAAAAVAGGSAAGADVDDASVAAAPPHAVVVARLPSSYEEHFALVAREAAEVQRAVAARVAPAELAARRSALRGWSLRLLFAHGPDRADGVARFDSDTTPIYPYTTPLVRDGVVVREAQKSDPFDRRLALHLKLSRGAGAARRRRGERGAAQSSPALTTSPRTRGSPHAHDVAGVGDARLGRARGVRPGHIEGPLGFEFEVVDGLAVPERKAERDTHREFADAAAKPLRAYADRHAVRRISTARLVRASASASPPCGITRKHVHGTARVFLLISSFCRQPSERELEVRKRRLNKIARNKKQRHHHHNRTALRGGARAQIVQQRIARVSEQSDSQRSDGVAGARAICDVHLARFAGGGAARAVADADSGADAAVAGGAGAAVPPLPGNVPTLLWSLIERSAVSSAAASSAVEVLARAPHLATGRCDARWKSSTPIAAGALVRLSAGAALTHSAEARAFGRHATSNATQRAATETSLRKVMGSPDARRRGGALARESAPHDRALFASNGSLRAALTAVGLPCVPDAVETAVAALRALGSPRAALSALHFAALNLADLASVELMVEAAAGRASGAAGGAAPAPAAPGDAARGVTRAEFVRLAALLRGMPVGVRAPCLDALALASLRSGDQRGGEAEAPFAAGAAATNPPSPGPSATAGAAFALHHPLDPPRKRNARVVAGQLGTVERICGAAYAVVRLRATGDCVMLPIAALTHALASMTPLEAAAALRWDAEHIAAVLSATGGGAGHAANSDGGVVAPGVALLPAYMVAPPTKTYGGGKAGRKAEFPTAAALYAHAKAMAGGERRAPRLGLCGASADLAPTPPRALSQLLRRGVALCDAEVEDAVRLASVAVPSLAVALLAEVESTRSAAVAAEAEVNVWEWYTDNNTWAPYSAPLGAALEAAFAACEAHRTEEHERGKRRRSRGSGSSGSGFDARRPARSRASSEATDESGSGPLAFGPGTLTVAVGIFEFSLSQGAAPRKTYHVDLAKAQRSADGALDFQQIVARKGDMVVPGDVTTARSVRRRQGDVEAALTLRAQHARSVIALQRWGGDGQRCWRSAFATSLVSTDGFEGTAEHVRAQRVHALAVTAAPVPSGPRHRDEEMRFTSTLQQRAFHLGAAASVWEPHVDGWFSFLSTGAMRVHDGRPEVGSVFLRIDGDEEGSVSDDFSDEDSGSESEERGPLPTKFSGKWSKARGLLRLRQLRSAQRRLSDTPGYSDRSKSAEAALVKEGARLRRGMGRWHGMNGNGTTVTCVACPPPLRGCFVSVCPR